MEISEARLKRLLGNAWERGDKYGRQTPGGSPEKDWADVRDDAVAVCVARVNEPVGDLPE